MIELRDASLRYPGVSCDAVSGVSLGCRAGELLVLLGPNGSGKSSALRLLAGVLAPTTGEALLEGTPVAQLPRDVAARRVALVPQSSTVTFDLSALEVTLLGRHPFGRGLLSDRPEDVRLAETALAEAGASGLRDRPYRELSGGERQRVVLARALAQGSPALLLDEPTSAQDLAHGLEVFALARRLARERNRAVVVATHDLNAAARHADRIAVLERGKLVASGEPRAVLTVDLVRRVFRVEPLVGSTPDGAPTFLPLTAIA